MHEWKVGGGVGDGGKEGRVLEGKKRIREMIDGLGDAIRVGKGDENVETAIVLGGGVEVEATGAVSRPQFPVCRRIVGDDELAGRVDGMGREIKGKRVKIVIGGEVVIDKPGTEGVEGKFGLGE
jgi:hypothetical protein